MKKITGWILIVLACLLTGCFSHDAPMYPESLDNHWPDSVDRNPFRWTQEAGTWFNTGEPMHLDTYAHHDPAHDTYFQLKHPTAFTGIEIDGDFEVQLVGDAPSNRIEIVGPHDAIHQVLFDQEADTLCIHQIKHASPAIRRVVIRISLHDLEHLQITGNARVYGRSIDSSHLKIDFQGNCVLFLKGNLHLTALHQTGNGLVTLLGINSPHTDVFVIGDGSARLSGHIGLHQLIHRGTGDVHIVGADSENVCIEACGYGLTTLHGYVNLKSLTARDGSRVYLYCMKSNTVWIEESGHAEVGLAGFANQLNIHLIQQSDFEGQYIRAALTYIKTDTGSHATITAGKNVLAATAHHSSIYYYGAPSAVSQSVSDSSIILAIGDSMPFFRYACPFSWDVRRTYK